MILIKHNGEKKWHTEPILQSCDPPWETVTFGHFCHVPSGVRGQSCASRYGGVGGWGFVRFCEDSACLPDAWNVAVCSTGLLVALPSTNWQFFMHDGWQYSQPQPQGYFLHSGLALDALYFVQCHSCMGKSPFLVGWLWSPTRSHKRCQSSWDINGLWYGAIFHQDVLCQGLCSWHASPEVRSLCLHCFI